MLHRVLTLERMRPRTMMLIQLSEMTPQARPSPCRQVSFITARSTEGHIIPSGEMQITGKESIVHDSAKLIADRTPNDEHHIESMDIA